MQLNELKKSMSTLEQVLAKTSTDIKIDVTASETAQTKILRKYRQGFTSTAILAIVFTFMWIGKVNVHSFPQHMKLFLVLYLVAGTAWYIFMYLRLKRINIPSLPPAKLLSETTSIKLLTLIGEIVFGVTIAVYLALLLPNALAHNPVGFWACIAALCAALVWSITYFWPRYIKLFRDLNTIKD